MANYCYGDMAVSGTKENVLNFLHKALIPVTATGNLLNINPIKETNVGSIKLITRNDNLNYNSIWIKNSNNGFLNSTHIPILNDNENDYQINLSIEFAWYADSNNIKTLAKEYNVSINIDVTEENNEFRQIINADNKGTLIKDIKINIHDNPNTNKSTSDFANNYKIINNFFAIERN